MPLYFLGRSVYVFSILSSYKLGLKLFKLQAVIDSLAVE